jgi:chromosomal replication initiator protein
MSADTNLREAVLAELEKIVDPAAFAAWRGNIRFIAAGPDRYQIPLPNDIYRQWVERQFRAPLETALRAATGRPSELEFITGGDASLAPWPAIAAPPAPAAPPPPPPLAAPEARPPRPRLNEHYTYDNFVVGPTNRLAHAAAVAVSETPGKAYNPLFIHGDVGLGKTHLLQAICHSLLHRHPHYDIIYLSCENFVNDYISAVQKHSLEAFRNRFRNADVLLIDDIHFLGGKEGSQEEFFHTFNALHNANRQIVLSSDSPAKDIPKLREQLLSRFVWGLETRIDPPTFEMRVAILRRKAEATGREIPEEVLDYVANVATTNIRELEGAVTKILGVAALTSRKIDIPFVQEHLQGSFGVRYAPLSIPEIQQAVCDLFKIKMSDLVSRKRSKGCSLPRQVAIYVSKELTGQSLADIGAAFGGKDHTTVIYSIQKIRELLETDKDIKSAVDTLLNSLRRKAKH